MKHKHFYQINLLVLLCLLIVFSVPHSALAFTTVDYCMEQEEQSFLTLLNNYRISNGLGALTPTQSLGAAAEFHSMDMGTYNYFSHTLAGPGHILGTADDVQWWQNQINFGYTNSGGSVGENIAAGYQTASQVFAAWKASPDHNANMLSKYFIATGVGRYPGATTANYQWYWSNEFGGYIDSPQVTRCNDGSNPDNTPPSLQVVSPSANQIVSGVVPITVNATDDRTVQRVEYYNQTYDTYSSAFATATSSPFTVSFDSLHAPNGINHLLFRAFDGYWNSVTVPLDVTVQNTSDTIPPVASIASPVDGSTIANPITLNVNASDNVGVYRVDYYVDNTTVFTEYTPNLSLSNWNNAPSGTHTLYAKVRDFQGNITTTNTITFTVSSTAPTSTPTPIQFPTPTVTPFPTPTAIPTQTPTPTPTTPQGITPTPTPLPTAIPTPTSTPIPTNTPVPTSTLTPTPQVTDTTPPTVSITNPLNNATVSKKSKVTITATATDNIGVTRVDFSVNNKLLCSSMIQPYSCVWSVPGKGSATYTIQATAYDAANNTTGTSVTVKAQ